MVFEAPESERRISKADYAARVSELRVGLLNAQFDLQDANFPVLVLIAGDDRQGCEELLDTLHVWMDARYIDNEVFLKPTDEERQRPKFWRY